MHHEFGPHFEPGLVGPNGRLARFHKGGGGDGGLKRMMAQNERHFQQQLALMREQANKNVPTAPKFDPSAAAPNQSRADIAEAEDQARRDAARRRGERAAILAGESTLGGKKTLLG
ncbi:hypothetical protein [Prosthecobacter dejongeii]|uniref:Uncharacterized protein n=1 Tax=Prosthecobacter dejongeii TaxID=48465 RepID=A0A7W8DPR2_9BACT|nr:hypothetical protein [Prosthecobacter dejongeii]MBB5037430.1 hypothetical protein [Prosthecobacter dejongeii]